MARTVDFISVKKLDSKAVLFDGLGDMAHWMDTHPRLVPSGWGLTRRARDKLHTGDASLVPRADKLMGAIEAASPMGTSKSENVRTVAGSMADVPAYLTGTPVNMRRRQRRETQAPLKIVVDVTSSASVRDETLERRGVAALALLRKLEATGHAVELWVLEAIESGACRIAAVRLETRPIDLARACWALSSSQFARECAYCCVDTLAGHKTAYSPRDLGQDYASALGVDLSTLIVLPPLRNGTAAQPFETDEAAVVWINTMYAHAIALAETLL